MRRSDLRTRVFNNTGRSDKTSVTNDGLDFGLKKLCQTYPFLALRAGEMDISFVATNLSIGLPQDMRQIVELRLIDPSSPTLSYSMVLLRKTDFVSRFPNVAGSPVSGRPYFCYRDGNRLYFDKKSEGSYTVRLTKYVIQKFNGDSDECAVPDSDEILIALSTAFVYRSIQMYDDAAQWDREAARLTQLAVMTEDREIGLKSVACEWASSPQIDTNIPWLDPFAGHESGY